MAAPIPQSAKTIMPTAIMPKIPPNGFEEDSLTVIGTVSLFWVLLALLAPTALSLEVVAKSSELGASSSASSFSGTLKSLLGTSVVAVSGSVKSLTFVSTSERLSTVAAFEASGMSLGV